MYWMHTVSININAIFVLKVIFLHIRQKFFGEGQNFFLEDLYACPVWIYLQARHELSILILGCLLMIPNPPMKFSFLISFFYYLERIEYSWNQILGIQF